ncbi:MAG TPA: ABC transporter permease [Candidatus Acidoferrales bacterium]|nr:ABC transporter permease [Candidatus Acidoferrales bacterium]
MDAILRFFRKLWLLIRRERFHDELAEEMAFHREQVEKEFCAEGMSSEAARYAALRQFGNATRIKEQSHEMVGFHLEVILQDFRFAIRQLRKNPGFALTAIFVLALGFCASVSIFAFVDAALLKPLPYPDPTRLVNVTESAALLPIANLSYPDYLDWKKVNTVFSSVDVHTGRGFLLTTPTGAEVVSGASVSDGFFRTLGIPPVLGRDFYSGEDLPNAPQAVILSYAAWQRRFGERSDVIGQAITLDGGANTIVGVLPEDFEFAPQGRAEFWTTYHPSHGCALRRGCHNLQGVARLKDGVSIQAAAAEMRLIASALEKQYPDTNRGQGASVLPLSEVIVGDIRPILLALLGGAGLLLLIASLNVSSLLLVRSESRKREIAVRSALGASFARLVRQFVTDGMLLVVSSGVLGLLLAGWSMQLLTTLIPVNMLARMPYLRGLHLNLHVLIFAGAISLLAAVLFSVTPMVRLRLGELREGLTEGGRGSAGTLWRRFGSNLVVVELAIAMVLLVGAGLLGQSLYRLLHVELGFQPDHLATLDVAVPGSSYSKNEQLVVLHRQILSSVSSLPGVKSVATAMQPPVSGNGNTLWIRFVGRPYDGKHNEVNQRDVSSGYFTTLKARLLRGRYFNETDDASKPGVVIINQALARRYFPGEDPLGKKIGDIDLSTVSIKEIIGIVEDIREGSLDSEIWPAVYFPENQVPDSYFSIIVRTSQDEQSIFPALTAAIRQIDPGIATTNQGTMSERIDDSPSAYLHRSSAWLVGSFAAMALLLGVVGLYGVIAYSVSQRTREIGVRMALGAQRRSVYQLILKEAGSLTALGIVIGLIGSVAAAALMRGLLFGVRSWDAPTLAAVAVVLALFALLASFFPARRAASVDPVEALRAE